MAKGSSGGAMYMKGMEKVMANLKREISHIKVNSEKGMVLAAAHVRNKTEESAPKTPVDLGNLRASWFITTAKKIERGSGVSSFKGPKKAKFAAVHTATLGQAQGEVTAMNTFNKLHVMMGYTVSYGGWVHEMLGAHFKRPMAGPQWLQTHIGRESRMIVQIIEDNAKVK